MFNRKVPLFNLSRVVIFYLVSNLVMDKTVKQRFSTSYKVNINDLFDQDEAFLFKSQSFLRLIKTVTSEHANLLNPNFDISIEC